MDYLKAYRQLKDDHPEIYTALSVIPISGSVAAIADYAEAMERGNTQDAALAAASIIPGIKLGKYASKLAPSAVRMAGEMGSVERAIAPAVKQADKIGKAMGAEQVGEYAAKKSGLTQDKANQQAAEYSDAWDQLNQ